MLSTGDTRIGSSLALKIAGDRRLLGPAFKALFALAPRMLQPDTHLVVVLPANDTRSNSLLGARLQSRICPPRCGNCGCVQRGSRIAVGIDGPRGHIDRESFVVY
jgi:hypothetical protein